MNTCLSQSSSPGSSLRDMMKPSGHIKSILMSPNSTMYSSLGSSDFTDCTWPLQPYLRLYKAGRAKEKRADLHNNGPGMIGGVDCPAADPRQVNRDT